MTDYAISTNLISWIPAQGKKPFFGWVRGDAEADVVADMRPGDLLVPKFAQIPETPAQRSYVEDICSALDVNPEEMRDSYEETVNRGGVPGAGSAPAVWQVIGRPKLNSDLPGSWVTVDIGVRPLRHPFSTQEFLKSRMVPLQIARQFKATTAPGRHVQRMDEDAGEDFLEGGHFPPGQRDIFLRKLNLIRQDGSGVHRRSDFINADLDPAIEVSGRVFEEYGQRLPVAGDLAFFVSGDATTGFLAYEQGSFVTTSDSNASPRSAFEMLDLLETASRLPSADDYLRPSRAISACRKLVDFLDSGEDLEEWEDLGSFYDGLILLPTKVALASRLIEEDRHSPRIEPTRASKLEVEFDVEPDEEESAESIEAEKLNGLTVAALEAQLDEMTLPTHTLAEAVTALRAGKHLLLSGPPGTGKSRLASAICGAVVDSSFDIATATADWTTFDTIGGYMPAEDGQLKFEPGIVLRSLRSGNWLVVDELNRADIDKAFGPLFTLLSGSSAGGSHDDVMLPYRDDGKSIRIVRSASRERASSQYAITPSWRLIGTLNVRDKASLFQLSFAFLRRFAVIDVPVPEQEAYRELIEGWVEVVDDGDRSLIVETALSVALGPRKLGPAIVKDIVGFVSLGLADAESGTQESGFSKIEDAILAGVRLYALPQYEGAEQDEIEGLRDALKLVLPEADTRSQEQFKSAVEDVRL